MVDKITKKKDCTRKDLLKEGWIRMEVIECVEIWGNGITRRIVFPNSNTIYEYSV